MAETKTDQKPDAQQPTQEPVRKLTPAEILELREVLQNRRLAHTAHPVQEVIEERVNDQRQEQQLYASTWAGWTAVVSVVASTTTLSKDHEHRKAMERIRDEMFDLLAKEEKKRKMRDSPFFQQLVSILGENAAESIAKSIDSASASALQSNKESLAQAAKDIAVTLERSSPHLNLSVGGEQLSKTIEAEMCRIAPFIPKTTPQLSLVRPDESAVVSAHGKLFALNNSEERLLEVQKLRISLGAEKFERMVDAYDKRFGVPIAAHITAASSCSAGRQAEMIHELRSVLTPAQRERLTEYGQAEYAQMVALVGRRKEHLEGQLEMFPAQVRSEERHLANALARPDLAEHSAGEVRGKMLQHLAKVYPELRGKTWEEAALTLKEIAGEKDDKVAEQLMRKLMGGAVPADTAALRESITRATIHMQKLMVLDQRITEIKSLLADHDSVERGGIKDHYTKVFGAEATKDSPLLASLTKSAALHFKHLGELIADPAISSVQREKLILERDAIEFGFARKIVASSLEASPPKVQDALKVLAEFSAHDIGSERRRSKGYLDAARAISDAIRSAEQLRKKWQDVGVSADFANIKIERAKSTVGVSCLSAGPAQQPDINLAARFKDLKGEVIGNSPVTTKAQEPAPKDQLRALAQQQEAALSTKWFAQIVDAGGVLETGIVPVVKPGSVPSNPELEGQLSHVERLRVEMDAANHRTRSSFAALDKDPVNTFASSNSISTIQRGVSPAILEKLGATSSTDLINQISQLADKTQELPVDASILSSLRSQARPDTAVGKALSVTPRDEKNPQQELRDVLSRLDGLDVGRVKVFVVLVMAAQASGDPQENFSWSTIENADPTSFMGSVNAGVQLARASQVERLLQKLSDAEQAEVLELFEATTRQSIGKALISGVSVNEERGSALALLAQSRIVTSADLERYLSGPVPQDRSARAQAILREFEADKQRRQLDESLTQTYAETVSQRYATLRAAAEAAAFNPVLATEITEQMRVIEAQLQGKIAQTLAVHDPAQVARQGFPIILKDTVDRIMAQRQAQVGTANSPVVDLARHVHGLLSSEEPKTDAAFNRIRQLNLSEEDTLLLKALYAAQVSSAPSARALTGDLSQDLKPPKPHPLESERIAAVIKGGAENLAQADVATLNRAIADKNEKVQLETLSNLRASGQYDAVKDKIQTDKLQPAASSYHQAVTSHDKVKADMADISVKARNSDLKPEEVATFVQGKSSHDLARIDEIDPNFKHNIKFSNPDYFDDRLLKVLSARESERKEALNQAMLKSLTDPALFAQWLNVPQTREAKAEALRALESLVEKQPTAPKFVTHADPRLDEPKIVQYVRAQKTDFREMDAYLINGIIVSALSTGTALKPEVLDQIRALRLEAAAQLKAMDAFIEPRESVVKAARQILSTYEGAQIWATGDPVLKGLKSGSASAEAQRAARLAELVKLHPNLAGRTEEMLEQGERGLRWEWWSGKHLDAQIPLTEKRIAAQRQLLAPMERGLTDSNQTRELMRATFGLRAKDAAEGVFRGLTAESTQNAMLLLRQRDSKIVYRVTDQREHEEWVRVTAQAESDLARKDKILNWSITISKVVVVVVVSAIPALGPGIGFAVATSINLLDKVRRRFINGEDFNTVNRAFWNELIWDGLFFAVSYSVVKYTASAGSSTAKAAGKQIVGEGTQRQSNFIIRGAKRILGSAEEAAPNLRRGGELLHISERSAASSGVRNAWDQAQKLWIQTTGGQGWQPTTFLIQGGGKSGRMAAWRPTDTKKPEAPLVDPEEGAIALRKKMPSVSSPTPPPATPKKEEVDPPYAFVVKQRPDTPQPTAAIESILPTPVAAAQPKPEPTAAVNVTATPSQNPGNSSTDRQPPPTPPAPPPTGGEPSSGGAGGPGGGNAPAVDPGSGPTGTAPGRGIQVAPPQVGNLPNLNGVAPPEPHIPLQGGTPNQGQAHGGPAVGPQMAAAHPGLNPNLQQNGAPNAHGNGVGNGNSVGHGLGNGLGTGVVTGNNNGHGNVNGVANPNGIATSHPQATAAASALGLDGLVAATATPRGDLQSNVMHNATANGVITAQPTPQPLAQPQAASANYLLEVADAQRVEALRERDRQILSDQYADSLRIRTEERLARKVRAKTTEASEVTEKSFAKVDATKRAERIAQAESIAAPVAIETPTQAALQITSEATPTLVEAAAVNSIASRERPAQSTQETPAEQRVVSQVERVQSETAQSEVRSSQTETPIIASTPTAAAESVAAPLSATPSTSSPQQAQHSTVENISVARTLARESQSYNPQQVEPVASSEATLKTNTPLPSTVADTSTATWPTFIPQAVGPTIANSDSGSSDEGEHGGSSAPKRKARKTDTGREARMRAIIMQQLMTQHLNKAQREKLLQALIDLGISEQEYRSLVAKLSEMEVTQIAQRHAQRKKMAEPIAVAQEAPAIKESVKSPQEVGPSPLNPTKPTSTSSPKTNRADIYKRLREEASAKRKSA